jgi:hypothetical protein
MVRMSGHKECIQILVGKFLKKLTLGRTRRCRININMVNTDVRGVVRTGGGLKRSRIVANGALV